MRRRWLLVVLWCAIAALGALRFAWLTADFPNDSPWAIDQAKFTDEGWWSQGAVMHQLIGRWSVPGDYNPVVVLPVWPMILVPVFHVAGVSVVAARAVAVAFSLATMGLLFWLMRRYGVDALDATVAVLLLSASPFVFCFSRLAILDALVGFELVALMVLASYARRVWALFTLALLAAVMLLTKTTAAVMLPAVAWLAWWALGRTRMASVKAAIAALVAPLLLLQLYAVLIARLGYGGDDYRYFFNVNAMSEIVWNQLLSGICSVLHDGIWMDRVLYPLGCAMLLAALVWLRRLWRNPLFTACWIAIGAQMLFLFRRSDDYAPRYFLVMMVPLIVVVVLGLRELRVKSHKAAWLLVGVLAVGLGANLVLIGTMLHRRTFDFYRAAMSLESIVRGDARQKPLLLGISGSELSLMTAIPSLNDAYGTMPLADKVKLYRPGWYVAWVGIGPDEAKVFAEEYRMVRVGSWEAFDDADRHPLILYRMERR